ncbi:hypothetical protein GCM10010358_79850 [Streptomyces minutiscleroticus]|uniref:Uncharacterized protein n=1 Tax=Streptomyces minutiscleroticus TaxID=68238 RepID=A0A918UA41_9ACTN|nr:hypothetical protein GCM10010358_79850 [Streptomyces minutiscleroticus]
MPGPGREDWTASGTDPGGPPTGWGWKVTRPSGRGFGDDAVDYAAALRDRRTVPVAEVPGTVLRRRKQPGHRAAPYASGTAYLPFTAEIPFGLWIFSPVPGEDEQRSGRTWSQHIWCRVPAWWALGPQGRTAAAPMVRLEQATWQEILALRRSYDRTWPADREDPAWYEAQALASARDRAVLSNALIGHAEEALSRAAGRNGADTAQQDQLFGTVRCPQWAGRAERVSIG